MTHVIKYQVCVRVRVRVCVLLHYFELVPYLFRYRLLGNWYQLISGYWSQSEYQKYVPYWIVVIEKLFVTPLFNTVQLHRIILYSYQLYCNTSLTIWYQLNQCRDRRRRRLHSHPWNHSCLSLSSIYLLIIIMLYDEATMNCIFNHVWIYHHHEH